MSARWSRRAGAALAMICAGLGPAALSRDDPGIVTVIQKGRAFSPTTIDILAGSRVRFTNEDPFIHQIFTASPSFSFDSEEQHPGSDVTINFPVSGDYQVLCGIHPKMSLTVHVR